MAAVKNETVLCRRKPWNRYRHRAGRTFEYAAAAVDGGRGGSGRAGG
jgi:hypothetical protein